MLELRSLCRISSNAKLLTPETLIETTWLMLVDSLNKNVDIREYLFTAKVPFQIRIDERSHKSLRSQLLQSPEAQEVNQDPANGNYVLNLRLRLHRHGSDNQYPSLSEGR